MRCSALTCFAALTGLAVAAKDTCASVEDSTSIETVQPLNAKYTTEQTEYWSTACSALKPSCILYPTTSDEVAAILKILSSNDEKFAVKSGGHNPNNYWSSIDGGPLISTKSLNEVDLDVDAKTVRVGPGNRWDDVIGALDGSGWTVVGGRIGNVGAGGLLLGGGLSFLSQQYGWAMSSILAMDVALANGTVVTASADEHPDLFQALKGGGNNYGVVTSFLLRAYQQDQTIYGGNFIFAHSEETDAKLLAALHNFVANNTDDKAAIILTQVRTALDAIDQWFMFVFYGGPKVPEGTFDEFLAAKPELNTAKYRSYADFLSGNDVFVVRGSRYVIGTETMPLPSAADSAKVLGGVHEHWRNVSTTVRGVAGVVSSIAYQPFPKRIAAIAKEKGADMIEIDDDIDRIIVELDYSWLSADADEAIDKAHEDTFGGIRDRVTAWQEEGKLPRGVYLPLFANDAYHTQDYYGRLKPENRKLAQEVAEAVDPEDLFRNRTGGWKP